MDKSTKVQKKEEQVLPTIQSIVVDQLVQDNNVSFQSVREVVKSLYPESKFSKACFYWYRRHTNRVGLTTPKINHPSSKQMLEEGVKLIEDIDQLLAGKKKK